MVQIVWKFITLAIRYRNLKASILINISVVCTTVALYLSQLLRSSWVFKYDRFDSSVQHAKCSLSEHYWNNLIYSNNTRQAQGTVMTPIWVVVICDYYLTFPLQVAILDKRIKSIKVPDIIARRPRPISDLGNWKGTTYICPLVKYKT